jgi:tetratricopeptide (TPR) repeat protein
MKGRARSLYGTRFHRKQRIRTALTVVLTLLVVSLASFGVINWRNRRGDERKELLELWEAGAYDRTFILSREGLAAKPADYFLLALHGFSSYQLAVAQINSFDTLSYIDAAVWSLRKALLTAGGGRDGRVYYVLGKAYYYKGAAYADLSVAYLEKARSLSYDARDIPEYLGLAYAALRDYRGSVAAFTLALERAGEGGAARNAAGEPALAPDLLLLSLARSYAALDEGDRARAYLLRCVESSRDFKTLGAARLLLGDILRKAGDRAGAEAQYLAVAGGDGENAEAHFRLGELYAEEGDPTRARSEWRRAARIDPAHRGARERLNM